MSIFLATWKPLDEMKDLLKKYNTGVEIQSFCRPQRIDNPNVIMDDVLNSISDTELRSMHAPFFGLNPACIDYKVSDVAKDRFSKAYSIGKKLNVSNIVFHTGYFFNFKPDQATLKRFGKFWNDFLRERKENIEIHFENVFEQRWERLKEFIDVVESDKVSACLDLGHVNINSVQGYEEWIKGLNTKIRYVHIHNNYGDDDSHNGLKRGSIDMIRVLNLLKEYSPDAIWSVETAEIEESINWLIKHDFYKSNGYELKLEESASC